MVSTDRFPHMKKIFLPLGLLFSCCLALFFQTGHTAELDNTSVLLTANRMTSDNPGSPSGRAFGQLVLAEKLGIDHPDQVVDFDYSTDTFPFYVTEADGTVMHHQTSFRWEIGLAPARRFAGKRNSPVSDCVWLRAE